LLFYRFRGFFFSCKFFGISIVTCARATPRFPTSVILDAAFRVHIFFSFFFLLASSLTCSIVPAPIVERRVLHISSCISPTFPALAARVPHARQPNRRSVARRPPHILYTFIYILRSLIALHLVCLCPIFPISYQPIYTTISPYIYHISPKYPSQEGRWAHERVDLFSHLCHLSHWFQHHVFMDMTFLL